jgi:hypothetical protein
MDSSWTLSWKESKAAIDLSSPRSFDELQGHRFACLCPADVFDDQLRGNPTKLEQNPDEEKTRADSRPADEYPRLRPADEINWHALGPTFPFSVRRLRFFGKTRPVGRAAKRI